MKKAMTGKKTGLFLLIIFCALHIKAQTQDTLTKPISEGNYKNSIKLNLTSWILYSSGIQMQYERVLSPKRSFTVFGGFIQFPVPAVIDNSSITFSDNKKKSGFSIGGEYRFYLSNQNKYAAPHGVYLAPFASLYHFDNERTGRDTVSGASLNMKASVTFVNIGAELGYQFVIKKRLVIDCVMFGPAISSYDFNVKLTGNGTGDLSDETKKVIEALKNKFPLLNNLSSNEGISKNGVSSFWGAGFRYCVMIGYRF